MPYSPRGIFRGLTQIELTALRVSALARITNGDRTALSGGQKSGSKTWQMSPQDELSEILYAEGVLNGTRRVQKVYQTMNEQFSHRRTE